MQGPWSGWWGKEVAASLKYQNPNQNQNSSLESRAFSCFSFVWLCSEKKRNQTKPNKVKGESEKKGLFTCNTPHRPNCLAGALLLSARRDINHPSLPSGYTTKPESEPERDDSRKKKTSSPPQPKPHRCTQAAYNS